MGTFTVSTQYVQNIYLIVDYSIAQRDGQSITLRDGTTQVMTAPSGVIPTDSDVDVTDWLFQVYRKGGTVSSARQTLVHNLVTGLKSDGVWSKLERLWLFAAENTQSALTDLFANNVTATNYGTTFTADRGFQGDGSTTYVDLGIEPGQCVTYLKDSAHFSVWPVTACTAGTGGVAGQNSDRIYFFDTYSGDNNIVACINGGPGAHQGVPAVKTGHWLVNRTGSSTSNISQNGALFSSPNETSAGAIAGSSTWNFHACGKVSAFSGDYSNSQVAMYSIGGGLTSTDITNFHNRLRTYMNAVGVYEAVTNAWAAQVVTNGGTVSATRKALVDTLIAGLIADKVWSKLDRLWLFAAENSQSALVDLVGANTATAVSSPTFTTDRGYAANGTSSYVNTNYNPTTNGTNFTLNACSFGAWDVTSRAVNASNMILGVADAAPTTSCYIEPFSNDAGGSNFLAGMNDATRIVVGTSQSNGFWAANRSASNAQQGYMNGSSLGTASGASVSLVNFTFWVGVGNRGNSYWSGTGTTDQIASAFMGGNLSSTDHANLYSRLRTYMTAVGVP